MLLSIVALFVVSQLISFVLSLQQRIANVWLRLALAIFDTTGQKDGLMWMKIMRCLPSVFTVTSHVVFRLLKLLLPGIAAGVSASSM